MKSHLNLKRKLLALVLVVALFITQGIPALAADSGTQPALVVSNAVGASGGTAEVTIDIRNNPGIVSMTLRVSYDDDVLTLNEVNDAGVLGTTSHKPELVDPYTLVWVNDTATTNYTVNGTIVTLVFAIADTAEKGVQVPVEITYDYDNYDIYDKDANKIRFDIVNGLVTVGEKGPNALSDFTYTTSGSEMVITGYTGTANDVVIGSTYTVDNQTYTVVEIAYEAFLGQETITSVVIPETVQSIGEAAFYDCFSLTEVTILSKDTAIGDVALGFYYEKRKEYIVEGFTIYGYAGSTAEDYAAAEEEITFVELAEPVCEHAGGRATCQGPAICEKCGLPYGEADASYHMNTEIRYASAATCNTLGYTGDTWCLDCKTQIAKGEIVPSTGAHVDADGKWESNEIQHYHTCECDTIFDRGNHLGGQATCNEPAICVICGLPYGTVGEHTGSTYLVGQKPATCYQTGYTGDSYCSDCNNKIADGTTIPTTDHLPVPEFLSNDTHHWRICSVSECQAVVDKREHTYTNSTTVCDVCGAKRQTTTQPGANALAHLGSITVSNADGEPIYTNVTLKANVRYALRFVAKATGDDARVSVNYQQFWRSRAVPEAANMRAYQILFTPAAQVDNFVFYLYGTMETMNWELYEAPTDGTFNLIPGSSMNVETGFLDNHYTAGATIVNDNGNSVLYMPSSMSGSGWLCPQLIGGFQEGKVWKLTFKFKGSVRIGDWTVGAIRPEQPDADEVRNNKQHVLFYAEDWKTVSYYLKPKDVGQSQWIQFAHGTAKDTYIDDVELYELSPSESFSIVEQNIRLYPKATQQLTYTWAPANSVLLGDKVQWMSSDETVATVDENGLVTITGTVVGKTVVITADNGYHQATTVITIVGCDTHTYDNACDADCNVCGAVRDAHTYSHVCDKTCNVCGDVRDVEHTFEWVVDREPTCGKVGLKHEICTRCGSLQSVNTKIPSPAHTYDNVYDMECNICATSRATGKCGVNATWRLANGVLTIGGSGRIASYSHFRHTPWAAYKDQITTVRIGNDIISIGSYAFAAMGSLQSVVFEEGSVLQALRSHVFHYCSNLKSVKLPDTVVDIDYSAFGYCPKLTYVYMPECAVTLYKGIFVESPNVVLDVVKTYTAYNYAVKYNIAYTTHKAVVPEGTALPGEQLLYSGTCGKSIRWRYYYSGKLIIEGSGKMDSYSYLTKMPWYEFRNDVRSVWIDKDITEIGVYSLATLFNLNRVVFEEGSKLQTIRDHAFHYCSALKSITLPEGVVQLEYAALGYCLQIENIYLPDSATVIYNNALIGSNLENVVVSVAADSAAYRYMTKRGIKVEVR